MARTKKVKSTGRYGARYGKKVRTRILAVEIRQKKKQTCPYCRKNSAKRKAAGIWHCKSCKKTFTANAYTVE
ncbi:hypothetical protein AUJ10_00680 [Candidatus Pacearchaeota archaeon CG1_02_31_27]|nr:MAG: hypothetical protein AUJ10_00680 [Candidatus Pacearchaeota archaeon CG1_02_31_27]